MDTAYEYFTKVASTGQFYTQTHTKSQLPKQFKKMQIQIPFIGKKSMKVSTFC